MGERLESTATAEGGGKQEAPPASKPLVEILSGSPLGSFWEKHQEM